MDIESKKYRIRSTGAGQVEIQAKSSGRVHHCPATRIPDVRALAMMHEREFDAVMQREMS